MARRRWALEWGRPPCRAGSGERGLRERGSARVPSSRRLPRLPAETLVSSSCLLPGLEEMPGEDAGEEGGDGYRELDLKIRVEEVGERRIACLPLLHLAPHRERVRRVPDACSKAKHRGRRPEKPQEAFV